MIIHECKQRTPEWWALKRGVPSASSFDRIVTPSKGDPSKSRHKYICELVAEQLSLAEPVQQYESPAMKNGIKCEPEARNWYEMECGLEVRQVGFCTTDDGRFGASPDGLVGEEGGLELKCPTGEVHTSYLLKGELPTDYKPQVHGELIVTGRPWWDFVSYHPGMKPFRIRVTPNDYTALLAAALEKFWVEYQTALSKVRGDKC